MILSAFLIYQSLQSANELFLTFTLLFAMDSEELTELRAAIAGAPNNIPLQKLFGQALLRHQKYEEAEATYKNILRAAPDDLSVKLGLATAFYGLSKTSTGLVLIEEMIKAPKPPLRTWLVYAKLLLQSGSGSEARDAYEKAVLLDPTIKDAFLESEINLLNQKAQEPQKIKIGGANNSTTEEETTIDIEKPITNFSQVGGMDQVKEEIRMKIIHPLAHPEIYKAYGKKIGGGILLYGPPGCGKTHLARATAGEVQSNFIPVGISDILDLYLGQSERNLHAIFEKARRLKPCVLFFDEADALGANRTDMRQSAGRHLINQFLSELDGIEYDNEGVLILAATNTPWHLDPAFRRPGRFDRIIFVPPPDEAARAAILKIHLANKPIQNIDYDKIAKQTKDFSGADLQAVIDRAIEQKLAAAMQSGVPQPLTTPDLLQAAKVQKPTTKEWFNTAKNYALFSNESGLYDDILTYLNLKK